MDKENSSIPEKKFNAGNVSAIIWNNQGKTKDGEEVEFRTIVLQRKYKDEDGEWQSTNMFRVSDVPKAVLVLDKAFEYLAQRY